jgi:glycerate 2-kinase
MSNPLRLRRDLHEIVRAAIDGVEPEGLVVRALATDPEAAGSRSVRVLCAGKGAAAMAAGAARMLGSRIVSGLIVSPEAVEVAPPFESLAGGHPLPTVESERAGRRALALAESVQPGERFLCLLSGGASALMAAPAAGISLEDKKATTIRLLRAGADITALNSVRKHLSDVKGGGLALRSAAGCHTLAISDVVGDDLAVIGSGPGVPDASLFRDAIGALRRFGGLDAYPEPVVDRLRAGERGDRPETLKPSDPRGARATARIIGSRLNAMDGVCDAARRLGYEVVRIDRPLLGEAGQAARDHVQDIARRIRSIDGPVCVVSSGETTVRVTGPGKGGRNQEFALAAAGELGALARNALLASVGTDGIDGPTDAAGAVVDEGTLDRARLLGLDPKAFLRNNDSYNFFAALGDLVITGRTGTNVGDLQVFLANRAGGTPSRTAATR